MPRRDRPACRKAFTVVALIRTIESRYQLFYINSMISLQSPGARQRVLRFILAAWRGLHAGARWLTTPSTSILEYWHSAWRALTFEVRLGLTNLTLYNVFKLFTGTKALECPAQ